MAKKRNLKKSITISGKVLQSTNKVKNSDKVLISGLAILSTIRTMDSFGKLGEEVLERYGVKEIEEQGQYPYELRAAMHKAALDRFGEIALVAFGFYNAENYQKPLNDMVEKLIEENKNQFSSDDREVSFEALNSLWNNWIPGGTKMIRAVIIGGKDIPYGMAVERIQEDQYILRYTLAVEAHQQPFFQGIWEYQIARFFARYWDVSIEWLENKTETGYGFSTFYWMWSFKKNKSTKTEETLVWERKSQLREELMQSVLNESEIQKNQLRNLSTQLGKYVPPQIHNALLEGKYDTEITTRRKKLTIFFSDIKNFTSTSEGLQPEDLTKYLNEYFSEMTKIALDRGATIDKYIGDAMMVFFGDPESKGEKEDARACVEMALTMQERMLELQGKWRNEGFADPFQIRMGMNTGYCNVGNFGSDQRLTYTIIGGEVNVAQRLEANTDAGGILMSYETYAHAQDMIEVEEKQAITMKGINREIKIFSVTQRKSQAKKQKKKDGADRDGLNKDVKTNVSTDDRLVSLEGKFLKMDERLDQIVQLIKKIPRK